jgi:phosphoenolpyruvate-protein phosphotransferase
MERTLRGIPAAPGVGIGIARVDAIGPAAAEAPIEEAGRAAEAERAKRALGAAASELEELAKRLRHEGRCEEADIIEASAMMASDPMLDAAALQSVMEGGKSAGQAILDAAEGQAALLAALDDANLAARAADVRSVGRRAVRLLDGGAPKSEARHEAVVLVAEDLGPAEVAELKPEIVGIALAEGGVTAHAAIVARSLGIPLVIGIGPEATAIGSGGLVVLDGTRGEMVIEPASERLEQATAAVRAARLARQRAGIDRELPVRTRDGRSIRLLANVSGKPELDVALASGTQGVGLLRTELGFLQASAWPTLEEHRRFLQPLFDGLRGKVATVRLLDFGGDKTPPFLQGTTDRGIELLHQAPNALRAQLEAILEAPAEVEVRILIPMVTGPDHVRPVREMVTEIARARGATVPQIGAMVEVPAAATLADRLAPLLEFFSIGTNDLTQFALGLDRGAPGERPAYHPAVLRLIDRTASAARNAEIPVDVCGEAASHPIAMPLLLGLGVDELSVGPARLGTVRTWVRWLAFAQASELAARALKLTTADEVEELMRPLSKLLEGVEAGGEGIQSGLGVLPFRPNS